MSKGTVVEALSKIEILHNVENMPNFASKTIPTDVVSNFKGVLEDFFGKSKIRHL